MVQTWLCCFYGEWEYKKSSNMFLEVLPLSVELCVKRDLRKCKSVRKLKDWTKMWTFFIFLSVRHSWEPNMWLFLKMGTWTSGEIIMKLLRMVTNMILYRNNKRFTQSFSFHANFSWQETMILVQIQISDISVLWHIYTEAQLNI